MRLIQWRGQKSAWGAKSCLPPTSLPLLPPSTLPLPSPVRSRPLKSS